MREGFSWCCAGALFAAWVGFAASATAQAQSAEDFFKGKSLRFTVVYEPGGTYDLYSRLLITHLPKHVPGNPTIVIQYMPGAGGMVGTVNLYEKAARDGTQLGMLPRDIAVNQMLHPDNARYDAKRFNWIGRIATYTGVMLVMSRTGVKTADDLRHKDVVVGSWGNTTDSFVTPTLLNALAGTRFKIVTGYRGAADVLPLISDLALSDDGRRILEFMNSDSSVGWNAIAPPEVPADRVAVLRGAFDATLRDPEFLADAQKQGLEIVPGRGDGVQQVVEHTLTTPPDLVARLAALISGQN